MPGTIDPNDIVGKQFGKLTVDRYIGKQLCGRSTMSHMYECHCSCGKTNVIASRPTLKNGGKISCGCAYQDSGDRVLEDLTGQTFGRWTVISRAPNRVSPSGKTRSIMWNCRCTCGTEKPVAARALKLGMSLSCGCLQKEHLSKSSTIDLTGQRFAHVVVLYRNGSFRTGNSVKAVWHCRCDCGHEFDVAGEYLRNGDVTSCGCSKTSKYEMYVVQYLESCGYKEGITYFREKSFPDLVGLGGGLLRFDFWVNLASGEDVLIECQGLQHKKSAKWFGGEDYFKRLTAHDALKREFAKSKNLRLIEVPHNLTVYDKIADFLAKSNIF